jgi:4-hydroxy-tetrahydrodipicolinate synthase
MFHGVIAALVTPLLAGAVCEESVRRLVATVRPHVTALLPALSTGEGRRLSTSQWSAMVSATVRYADGLPVVAGILAPSTESVLARAAAAERFGAAAVAAGTPFGPDVPQERMYRHYERLAGETGLPVVVYHESTVSGNRLQLATLLRICRLPGIAAVKDSAGDPAFTRRLVAARPGVPVLQGLEHLLGACGPVDGHVLALSVVEPELCAAAFAAPADAGLAARVRAARDRYGLDRDDFFRMLKTELHRRGVLATADVTDPGKDGP